LDSSFPTEGKDKKEVKKELEKFRKQDIDFSSGQILGSMCTEPLDAATEIYKDFIEANLGNPGLYKGTEKIEEKVHRAVAGLIEAEEMCSHSVGGGTEANILALLRARERSGKRKVILPKSAHFSFEKACLLLDMEARYVSLDEEYRVDIREMEEAIDDETAAVVGIAGTTEHGVIDPIEDIAEISEDIHFHVDAAFGGFVIPFLKMMGYDVPSLDAKIDGIDSISIDPHKMGMSPVPLGLLYSKDDDNISVDSPYLTGDDQKTLRGTRASASIPAFWATINILGIEGYKEIVSDCMDKTYHLVKRMEDIGFECITEPTLNIASFHSDDPEDIVTGFAERDWYLSRTVTPPGLRFVVMPHVNETSIESIVRSLDEERCLF